jgi:thiamine pyrophosphate-dependent acetolactate synthase large subunit-like protein
MKFTYTVRATPPGLQGATATIYDQLGRQVTRFPHCANEQAAHRVAQAYIRLERNIWIKGAKS